MTAWLATAVVAMIAIATQSSAGEVVGGLILLAWGTAVSTNYGGVANAMPHRVLGRESSTARIQMIFATFACVGVVFLIQGAQGL
jgi:hypothetical protein